MLKEKSVKLKLKLIVLSKKKELKNINYNRKLEDLKLKSKWN